MRILRNQNEMIKWLHCNLQQKSPLLDNGDFWVVIKGNFLVDFFERGNQFPLRSAMTGSFFDAIIAGIKPAIKFRTIARTTRSIP